VSARLGPGRAGRTKALTDRLPFAVDRGSVSYLSSGRGGSGRGRREIEKGGSRGWSGADGIKGGR
jgi:hypothetical protein